MIVKQPQLQNIVVLRSFAIIAVVLYHCYCPWLYAWDWFQCPSRSVYSFIFETLLVGRMPLFVCVSGYLFSHLFNDRGKYKEFKPFLINKVKRLLIPCLLFTALMSLCLQMNYIEAVVGYGFHLWFLKMLFWCFMSCWAIAKFVHNKALELILLGVSGVMMFVHAPEVLGIGQYFKYFSFFYGGYLFYKYRKALSFVYIAPYKYIVFGLYAALCVLCGWRYFSEPTLAVADIIHADKIVVMSRMLLRPLMILAAFILVDSFLKRGMMFEKIFVSLNKLSYGIYLFHMLFIQALYKYCLDYIEPLADSHYILGPMLIFVVVITLSVLLTSVIRRTRWGIYLIG